MAGSLLDFIRAAVGTGWNPDVQMTGVRPDYGLSTVTGILPAQRSPYDPTVENATAEDVRGSLGELILAAGAGAVPGVGPRGTTRQMPGARVRKTGPLPKRLEQGLKGEEGFSYHATNTNNLFDIARSRRLKTFKPSFGTEQETWPDGSIERRAYFSRSPENSWQFAPEGSDPVILRTRAPMRREGTGDLYTTKPIPARDLEYLGMDGNWHSVPTLPKD